MDTIFRNFYSLFFRSFPAFPLPFYQIMTFSGYFTTSYFLLLFIVSLLILYQLNNQMRQKADAGKKNSDYFNVIGLMAKNVDIYEQGEHDSNIIQGNHFRRR